MGNPLNHRILAISFLTVIFCACNFKSDIAPLELEQAPEQPAFGAIDPGTGEEERFPGETLIRRLDEMFDPFYMGEGVAYAGTVYEHMDQIIAGAYEYYGFDLEKIAANGEPNPLTDQEVFDYLSATNQLEVYDEATGTTHGVYDWHYYRTVSANVAPYISVLDEIDPTLRNERMNYERHYLAALYKGKEGHMLAARIKFRQDMIERFGDDAEGMAEFIESIEPVEQ